MEYPEAMKIEEDGYDRVALLTKDLVLRSTSTFIPSQALQNLANIKEEGKSCKRNGNGNQKGKLVSYVLRILVKIQSSCTPGRSYKELYVPMVCLLYSQ